MKKTLYFFTLISCFAVNAQKAPKQFTFQDLIKVPSTTIEQVPTEKALGVTLWSDDFSDTTSWVINNSGQSGIDFGWNINSVNDGWWAANGINSTSHGNYAELVNGNPTATPATQALNVIYTLTTAQPIDIATLGGSNQVSLQFLQYGARFNDLQEIQISTDGVNFTSISNNSDQPVLSSAGGAPYANPSLKTINLSTILPSTPAPIWIRFSWTTAFPGSASNPNVWITYGWYIDDVKIVTNPDNDLQIKQSNWGTAGLNYYQIPTTQVAPIDFSARIFNSGINPQYNVVFNVNANAGVFTSSSSPTVIAPMDSADVQVVTSFTPPSTVAGYSVVRSIVSDSTDDVPTNNTLSNVNFNVTNFIYARDNGSVSGNTNNGTDGFEAGNLFDIFQDQTLKAINVRLAGGGSGTTIGTEIYAKLYSVDPQTGDFVYEAESDPFIVASNNLNTNLVLQLQTAVNLVQNTTYLAVVGSYTGGLKISNAGTSDALTSFFFDAASTTWFYQTSTPYVRMNFDPTIGIEENDMNSYSFVLSPNPTNGLTSLTFNSNKTGSANVYINDASGKTISSTSSSIGEGTNNINLSTESYNAGVYFVRIEFDGAVKTFKLIKK